jgi:hypothetical protein
MRRLWSRGQRAWPLLCLLAVVAVLTGCATAAQRQAQQSGVAIREAMTQFKACVVPILDKPEYAPLLVHTPDIDTGQHTMAQLTDETIPSVEDARLFGARFDDSNPCRSRLLTALSTARPDVVPILARSYTHGSAIVVLIVERKITWAEAARRSQENSDNLREQLTLADRQWIADLNASHQAELAQRQAASSALMQWSEQQQLINSINRPVQTNCSHMGAVTNCTSY